MIIYFCTGCEFDHNSFFFTNERSLHIGNLLVDDLEFVSLLKAQVAIMGGVIAVYGHRKAVCKNIVCFN